MLDYFTQSPLSHSNTSKLPKKNYWNDTQATMFRHFTAKAPFTHRFQITGKFCDIINQKWPLNGCASRCCVYKHGGVYVVSIFVDVFIFVSNVHIHAAGFGPETSYDGFKLNYTVCGLNASSTSECYDWPRAVEFWIECYDWPRVHVLRQCLLNLYMLNNRHPVRPLTLNFYVFILFFSDLSSFPIKMLATDAKMQKIEPDPIFFFYDRRKFRRQCVNVIDTTVVFIF